eukprot:TRINITY_DN50871_c0_g1_i1.p1 TRINITY_DN50871_c0_g1~~TRINITY_DN50871_c0_g1_i1.p1  ORF type:complete len:342 (-),score=48.22 TRINITY_DN50871_c0_g1_i1:90-992(-)
MVDARATLGLPPLPKTAWKPPIAGAHGGVESPMNSVNTRDTLGHWKTNARRIRNLSRTTPPQESMEDCAVRTGIERHLVTSCELVPAVDGQLLQLVGFDLQAKVTEDYQRMVDYFTESRVLVTGTDKVCHDRLVRDEVLDELCATQTSSSTRADSFGKDTYSESDDSGGERSPADASRQLSTSRRIRSALTALCGGNEIGHTQSVAAADGGDVAVSPSLALPPLPGSARSASPPFLPVEQCGGIGSAKSMDASRTRSKKSRRVSRAPRKSKAIATSTEQSVMPRRPVLPRARISTPSAPR